MSVKVVETSPQSGSGRGVSGHVVRALAARVSESVGLAGMSQVLALAGERRTFSALGDTATWSSLDEAAALFDAAALVTGDGAIALHVGQALVHLAGDELMTAVVGAGSIPAALHQVGPLLRHFEGTSEAVLVEVAHDHAVVRVAPIRGALRHAHLCEMTRGLLAELPVAFGSGPAMITERECSARGGRQCLYAMSWDDRVPSADGAPETEGVPTTDGAPVPPDGAPVTDGTPVGGGAPVGNDETGEKQADTGTTAAPAGGSPEHGAVQDATRRERGQEGSEIQGVRALLEGTFATARELLHADAESLLAEIAARADALVTAPRHLLMVRVRPGTPVKLHYRGLGADEAKALAAELWPGHPDDAAGTRLVVDIASGRHRYGRLVALVPTGARVLPEEARMLRLYADYSATALDVFGVLDDARRSDATARTLLSFAERLSGLTTPADLVQLLADTVPEIAGCERASVFLWERESGRLVPRARSSGSQSPDAYLGPIVPIPDREPAAASAAGIEGGAEGGAIRAGDSSATPNEPSEQDAQPDAPGVRVGMPVVDRLISRREVVVIDESCEDPVVRTLLTRSDTSASVVTPLFAAGEFLGVMSANFGDGTPAEAVHDPALHERLSGLADQAATALQNLGLLEKVSHMAWHDSLTGLPNRRLFEDRVEQELVRSRRVGEPVCMFFVDLDFFKGVNDTLGHAAGDDLIRQVSRRLVDTVRRQDTVARVGGDEFAILLPGIAEQADIDELALRTLEAMSTPFSVFGEEIETSASIGIAMAPEHGDSYDDLLNRADQAMYRAKALGRNCFEMFSGPAGRRPARTGAGDAAVLLAELDGAVERNEFFVMYQPYIDLRTSEVVGVEALVRWRHPRLGVLEPSSFIGMAERTDTIVALDSWVLHEACRQGRQWFDSGLGPFRLAVNLASRDLADPGLTMRIERTLAETGVDPALLDLELTERVVFDQWGPAKENIERLRALGVRFTIDDFGAGNSSLDRVGALPASTLKINQSFVQVLGPGGEDGSLVAAIVSMADRLGLDCVAEGVETSVQSRLLLQRGVAGAQGYYFSPPLSAEDIARLMGTIAAEGPVELGNGS